MSLFRLFRKVFWTVICYLSVHGVVAQDQVKVISFNVRNSSAMSMRQDGENYWTYRSAAVARMISQEAPDAIGLQEALNDQVAFMDSVLVDYQRVGVGRDDGKNEGENMAVYFRKDRYELIRSATYWLSETPELVSKGWDAACRRTVTMVHLREKNSGREWVYMNTHLDHVGKVARAESVRLLARLAREWIVDGMPVVLGGDMNSSLQDTIFQSLSDMGFRSAREVAAVSDSKLTYNAFGRGTAMQIDHFFVRGIEPKSFQTLDADYGAPYISDHYPVALVWSW